MNVLSKKWGMCQARIIEVNAPSIYPRPRFVPRPRFDGGCNARAYAIPVAVKIETI